MSKEEEVKKILIEAENCGLLMIYDDKDGTVADDISNKIVNLFSPPPVIGDLRELIAEKITGVMSCYYPPSATNEASHRLADSILNIIKEAGLVKLDKAQIQLSDTDEVIIGKVGLDPFVVRGMVKAGWRKIE